VAGWLVTRWSLGGELVGGETPWGRDDQIPKTRLPRWLTTRATTFFLNQLLALIKNGHDFIASKDKEKKSHLLVHGTNLLFLLKKVINFADFFRKNT